MTTNQIKAQISGLFGENDITAITPLMNASINEDIPAVNFFIKSNPATINQQNIGGATALHISARKGNLEICKILITNGANIDLTDNDGWTPLMRAISSKNFDLVQMLLNYGANTKKINSAGETAIVISAHSECSECLKEILPKYKSDENFDVRILKNQLDDAMMIARNRNDLLMQSVLSVYVGIANQNILPGTLNGTLNEALNNEKNFKFSNKPIITEQLPELMQNNSRYNLINKKDTENGKIVFEPTKDRYGKKMFIFKGEDKSKSSQHFLFNQPAKTNSIKASTNDGLGRYKFLGDSKYKNQQPNIAKPGQISEQNKYKQINIDKKDEEMLKENLKANNSKKIFIFKSVDKTSPSENVLFDHNQSSTINSATTISEGSNDKIKYNYKFLGRSK